MKRNRECEKVSWRLWLYLLIMIVMFTGCSTASVEDKSRFEQLINSWNERDYI